MIISDNSLKIPIKNINQAKHRLKPVLYPDERQEFSKAMFEDVLSTMMAVPEFEQVAVFVSKHVSS